MKKTMLFPPLAILIMMLLVPAYHAAAQSTGAPAADITGPNIFDTSDFPLWAKDLRRWEIVAFGSFPFTVFATTFAMDTRRWIDQNNMDFSEDGRRYAPWPLKSAGALEMTNKEHETTLLVAAGISVALALVDFIIVQIKRNKARQAQSLQTDNNIIINKTPWPGGPADNNANGTGGANPESSLP
jgi:hypothetical protein